MGMVCRRACLSAMLFLAHSVKCIFFRSEIVSIKKIVRMPMGASGSERLIHFAFNKKTLFNQYVDVV